MSHTHYTPGSVVVFDFRESPENYHPIKKLKCIQWNIERGYRLDAIIDLLVSHDADVICLQEVDIGCERSQKRNCAIEIAQILKMKCAFLVEFEEIFSPSRSPLLQGGGVHGNAILSRFDFEHWVVNHSYHPENWERDGERLYGEPRKGERAVIGVEIKVPGIGPVVCYSLHLEVFCGIFGRIKQYADVLEDCRLRGGFIQTQGLEPLQLIFGDFNTMAHGIAQLSPKYCCDSMRFMTFGTQEGCWWRDNIFSQLRVEEGVAASSGGAIIVEPNPRLVRYVPQYLTLDECVKLRSDMRFEDPFSITKDFTVQNHAGLYSGKLDWTLCRNFTISEFGMDNHDFSMSDHKLLFVVVEPTVISDKTQV